MLNDNDVRELAGVDAYDADGDKVGRVGQIYLDDETGRPEFATVHTGLFGTKETFVPLEGASRSGEGLRLPYQKAKIKDAPSVDPDDGHISNQEEQALFEYYGLAYGGGAQTGFTNGDRSDYADTDRVRDNDSMGTRAEGYDTSGPTTDDAMTRSEEQVRVGTAQTEVGRARLRKYVTTEQETHTVPVRKEKAVLETEPITDANVDDATSGPDISEEEHEVTLTEERPVIQKETVPVERVRLGTEEVVDQQTVTEEVRKEHIEAEGDVDRR